MALQVGVWDTVGYEIPMRSTLRLLDDFKFFILGALATPSIDSISLI